jgi:predicted enzyme related to lactoylglutathione lyase
MSASSSDPRTAPADEPARPHPAARAVTEAARAVTELRLVITAEDHDAAVAFYRDTLGLPQLADFSGAQGRVLLLDAGRATIEIADPAQADYIDRVEVGRRVAGPVRVALQVPDAAAATRRLAAAGAEVLAEPTRTPWGSLNARLEGPAVQLTLFEGD